MSNDDPKYVRLAPHRKRSVLADVGGSGWSLSGGDVAEFPEDNQAAKTFVRYNLRRGHLEPCSKAEFEEAKEGDVEAPPEGAGHQEHLIRDAADAARKEQESKKGSESEEDSDTGDSGPAKKKVAAKKKG